MRIRRPRLTTFPLYYAPFPVFIQEIFSNCQQTCHRVRSREAHPPGFVKQNTTKVPPIRCLNIDKPLKP